MEQRILKKILQVDGMSCANCEIRIENKLSKLDGVVRVKAVFSSSNVYVTYDADRISLDEIIEEIEKLDYTVMNKPDPAAGEGSERDEKSRGASAVQDKKSINQMLGLGIILLAVYLVVKNTVGFNFIPEVNQSMGYGLLFVVGLLTSLHCVAMCGGINLSQCVAYQTNSSSSGRLSKLKPSLLYNAGRVVSYTVVGGVVGALGSVVSFSGAAKGIVAILSGIFMVIMGLNMLNIFPWLRKLNPRMPKIFGNKIYNNKGKYGPFIVGLLNGLMPCGPLQSMQIYALGTGSPAAGAISMFLFSLGTVPLMFGFGAVSSLLSGKFTHKMLKVSAVLVIVLGFVMTGRGLALSGVNIPAASGKSNIAKIEGNVQVVETSMSSGRYTPIIVQKGIPVKWTIQAKASDLNGCNNPMFIPQFNQQYKLTPGDNVIEFTPEAEGNIPYSCWMGMIRSNIKVVSDLSAVTDEEVQDASDNSGAFQAKANIPTDKIGLGEIRDGVQYARIDVGDDRFSPAIIVLEKGVETKLTFSAKELQTHNSSLTFPEYNAGLNLNTGETTIGLTPESDFTFLCSSGTLYGYVKVVDDIDKIDIDKIKDEVKNYQPPNWNIGGAGGASCH
jgi:sulfite exporter TauE/SafE